MVIFSESFGELPTIQMPEYVIEGVENATRVPAERIPSEITIDLVAPEELTPRRPEISNQETEWKPPTKPDLSTEPGNGYLRASVIGGGFNLFGGSIENGGRHTKFEYAAAGRVNNPSQRTAVGHRFNWVIDGGLANQISSYGLIQPWVSAYQYSFNRYDTMGVVETARWTGYSVGVATTPVITPAGSFSGRMAYEPWAYNLFQEKSNEYIETRLDHSLYSLDGRFENRLSYENETIQDDEHGLNRLAISVQYSRMATPMILVRGGGSFYSGLTSSVDSSRYIGLTSDVRAALQSDQNRQGANIWIGTTIKAPFGGSFDVEWKPQSQLEHLHSKMRNLPVVSGNSRGSLIEDIGRLKVGYERTIIRWVDAELSFEWSDSRHRLFPINTGNDNWMLISRRENRSETRLSVSIDGLEYVSSSMYILARKSRTDGSLSGDRSPLVSPIEAGCEVTGRIGMFLPQTRIIWCDKAPLEFDGTSTLPERFQLDAAIRANLWRSLDATLGVDNILNRHWVLLPRYNAEPLTIYIRMDYRFW